MHTYYFSPNSLKNILEISGFDLEKNDFVFFENSYLQSVDGYKGKFCSKYLNSNYDEVFQDDNLNKIVFYKNSSELILKLSIIKNKIDMLIYDEFISPEKLSELNQEHNPNADKSNSKLEAISIKSALLRLPLCSRPSRISSSNKAS